MGKGQLPTWVDTRGAPTPDKVLSGMNTVGPIPRCGAIQCESSEIWVFAYSGICFHIGGNSPYRMKAWQTEVDLGWCQCYEVENIFRGEEMAWRQEDQYICRSCALEYMGLRQRLCLDPERNGEKKGSQRSLQERDWHQSQRTREAFMKMVKSPQIRTRVSGGMGQYFKSQSCHCEELWDWGRTGPWGKAGAAKSQESSFRKMATVRDGERQTWPPSCGSLLQVLGKTGMWLRVKALDFWILLATQARWKEVRAHEPGSSRWISETGLHAELSFRFWHRQQTWKLVSHLNTY